MVREDRVIMRVKELRRVSVIRQTMEKTLTQVKAGILLGLTPRHIRRLIERVQQAGDQGLAHRGRGKPSNRRIPEAVKAKGLKLYAQRYGDFGPTLAAEKLAERHGIAVSAETLRGWLLATGVTHFRRRKRPHRAWRARKAHLGELVQLDGSHHDWFEGRGARCVLMAYIDDASSRVFARFYDHEGTIPAMDSFQRYVMQYGVPLALYADKHTTYQSPAEPTVEEQLAGTKPQSQFGRALSELGVELIAAHRRPGRLPQGVHREARRVARRHLDQEPDHHEDRQGRSDAAGLARRHGATPLQAPDLNSRAAAITTATPTPKAPMRMVQRGPRVSPIPPMMGAPIGVPPMKTAM